MVSITILYQDVEQIESYIEKGTLNRHKECLIRIHAAGISNTDIEAKIEQIIKVVPLAKIIGCSSSGIIYEGEQYETGILVSIFQFEKIEIKTTMVSFAGLEPADIAKKVKENIGDSNPEMMFVFAGDLYLGINQLTYSLVENFHNTQLVGGMAGYARPDGEIDSYVINGTRTAYNAVAVAALIGNGLNVYTNVIIGHEPISDVYTFNKVNQDYIEEIEGTDAAAWIQAELGLTNIEGRNNWSMMAATDLLTNFPLVLEDRNGAGRFLRYEPEGNRMRLYFSKLDKGERFRIGYLSPLKSAEEWQGVYKDLEVNNADTVFVYSCLFRKLYLGECSQWEVSPFKHKGIHGAFMFGEIGSVNKKVDYHNGCCSFCALGENSKDYVLPNRTNLDHFYKIQDDNKELLNQVLKIQSDSIYRYNQELMRTLLEQEKIIKDRLFIDETFGLENMAKFNQDRESFKHEKICFVGLENSRQLFAVMGAGRYKILARENLNKIKSIIESEYPRLQIKFYSYDFSSFFFVVQEEIRQDVFLDLTRYIYSKLRIGNYLDNRVTCSNRFVVTLSGADPNELMNMALVKDETSQDSGYQICGPNYDSSKTLKKELDTIAILNNVINNNAVEPYFQGIYDNETGELFAYEALMRIKDNDGNVLTPYAFMDIAKKYHLYLPLSQCMIKKVFELFNDRDEKVSINLSMYDVTSETTNKLIFDLLKQAKHPENFIFEILESEQFVDLDKLRVFIRNVKRYGVKIAVDDFGTGYSNFLEIGNMEIDYVKITGSLVSAIGTDATYDKIINSIMYLSEKIGVDVIAEQVENEQIQKYVLQCGIKYSQGYLFFKPVPFDEISPIPITQKRETIGKIKKSNSYYTRYMEYGRNLITAANVLLVVAIVSAVMIFADVNRKQVESTHDTYLLEITTGMADKISMKLDDSMAKLNIFSDAISYMPGDSAAIKNFLEKTYTDVMFDNMYASINGGELIALRGDYSNIKLDDFYKGGDQARYISSPVANPITKEKVFLMGVTHKTERGNVKVIGEFNINNLYNILDLKSFGGRAFFHINEVSGTPILISSNNNNLFAMDNMYDFIGTLDIKNGYTPEIIKIEMKRGRSCLLKYNINGQSRSAVMIPVPGTQWCLVSIITDEINERFVGTINRETMFFVGFILLAFLSYVLINFMITRRAKKDLIHALEQSNYLAGNLQLSVATDALTKVYSRAMVQTKIADAIEKSKTSGAVHAILELDVDNFKGINDTYGHQVGDLYLTELATTVKSCLRIGDIIGRLGGDEFIILLDNIESEEKAIDIINDIMENCKEIVIDGVNLENVTVSIGFAMCPQDSDDYETLIYKADHALYQAKGQGKNCYIQYKDEESFREI